MFGTSLAMVVFHEPFAVDVCFAGVGRYGSEVKPKPIGIIMACEARQIPIGEWS
jgi:hypothetical protein